MTVTRINLLPPEIIERRKRRRLIALMGVAGAALVVLLGVVYAAQEVRLRGERTRLEEQEAKNAVLKADAARLGEFSQLDARLQSRLKLLDALTASEVRWSVLLADISLVIPSNVWLNDFSASVTPGQAEENLGQIAMRGTTFQHVDVAKWLTRLARVDAFSFPYISLSTKSFDETLGTAIVNFDSTVQLAPPALRQNQRGGERRL